MKKLLLSLLGVILTGMGYAQTGSITIVNIPDQIAAGTTADLSFTYTSDVQVDFVVQLFQTQAGGLSPDFNTYVGEAKVTAQPAGTNLPVTVQFTVPGSTNPTASLPSGRQYTFAAKLATPPSGEFGWSNGTDQHTVEILPSSVVVDNINFTGTTPATINPGETLIVPFEYTLSAQRNVKAGLAIYNSSTGAYIDNAMVDGNEVAQYYSDQAATTTTPVPQTASIVIPANITPSSELPAGQEYKVVITIAQSPSWAYITDRKNSITINAPAGIFHAAPASRVSVYPNPVSDVVTVSFAGTLESVSVYTASGSRMNLETGAVSNNTFTIATSALDKGIYMLQVVTSEGVSATQLVK